MIILHGAGLDGEFYLWGEKSVSENPPAVVKCRRKTAVSRGKTYPYDAGGEELLRCLDEISLSFPLSARKVCSLTAWLPSQGDHPIPSSEMIAAMTDFKAGFELVPRVISGYCFSPEEWVEFLLFSSEKQTLAAGMIVGTDLAWWGRVLHLAGSLAVRQQYLPGLAVGDKDCIAQWQPVLGADDKKRIAGLAGQMPPVVRAITAQEASAPPEQAAETVLKTFLTQMLDSLVRTGSEMDAITDIRYIRKRQTFASVHDAWLYALRSKDGRMEYDRDKVLQLAEQIRQWRRPITVSEAAPVRLCFRLEEPQTAESEGQEPAAEKWQVRYLAQPHADPSLLIPLSQVWKAKGKHAAVWKHWAADLPEYMLSCLGQAAGICPHIAASLRSAQPAGYGLDTVQAYQFLTERAVLLEQAGFGVMLPAWWTGKGTKTRLSARAAVNSPKMQGGSGLSLDEIVQFHWEIALGEETLSLAELQTLARLKAPLVRVRGQWVQLNAREIQEAIQLWKKKGSQQATAQEIIRMSLGAGQPLSGFAFEGVKATGWIDELLQKLQNGGSLEPVGVWQTFGGTLRPYQERGYAWLAFLRRWGLGACLADDMGLGKTIQTLALIQRDWHSNGKRPVLLVCPTSVVNNWQKEAARFTPDLPVLIHHGSDRRKGAAFARLAKKQAMVISSYALLQRDIEFLQMVPWAGVVLDEAQNIKNSETKQSRAARSLQVDYRIALTGTPVENNVGDLWSIMEFLNPGFLGSQAAFKRDYFIPIQAGRNPYVTERLKRITGPFVLRRLKTDKSIISDLPEKQEMKVFCPLTKEQASLYAAVLDEAEGEMDSTAGIQRKGIILATLSKLKQVCNHPAQLLGDNSAIPGRSGKLARLTEMLAEILEMQDRALIFSQFAEMGHILQTYLQETFGREVLFLHGGVTKKKRDQMVENFQSETGAPIFVLSLKAGGTGLNLTRASHVFHFDRWWNPAVENQATDRAFRIGQTKNVQVHKFLCAGTLEDKIDEMIERKKRIAGDVIGTGEGWLTELSNEQLKDIFALRQEAVAE